MCCLGQHKGFRTKPASAYTPFLSIWEKITPSGSLKESVIITSQPGWPGHQTCGACFSKVGVVWHTVPWTLGWWAYNQQIDTWDHRTAIWTSLPGEAGLMACHNQNTTEGQIPVLKICLKKLHQHLGLEFGERFGISSRRHFQWQWHSYTSLIVVWFGLLSVWTPAGTWTQLLFDKRKLFWNVWPHSVLIKDLVPRLVPVNNTEPERLHPTY